MDLLPEGAAPFPPPPHGEERGTLQALEPEGWKEEVGREEGRRRGKPS